MRFGCTVRCGVGSTHNTYDEHRIAAQLARVMAMARVHNSQLKDLHAGLAAASHKGDGCDVIVKEAKGALIPLSEVSRIDDDEMRSLISEIVERLHTFLVRIDDLALRAEIDCWAANTAKWDVPKPATVLSAIPTEMPERG